MHLFFNALAYLAIIISYAPAAGFAVLGPVLDHAPPWAAAAFGAALLLAPPALSAVCTRKFDAPDLFGVASGELCYTSLFALPVILIALYHAAIANTAQAIHDFDFAATLCALGVAIALIGEALPLRPEDDREDNHDL
jgi:hypothetical protein